MKKLWNLKISPYKSGYLAEALCRFYMRLHGYRIVAKNYKCGSGRNTACGELDFVAVRRKTVIFCEVKKRRRTEDFTFALSFKQQQRIMRGAQQFMRIHPKYRGYSMQFDVFFVQLPFNIIRIKNALSCNRIQ